MKTLKPFNNMPSTKDVETVLRKIYPTYTDRKIKNAVERRMIALEKIAAMPPVNRIKIKIQWTKSRTWGLNPTWEAWAWGETAKGGGMLTPNRDWHRHAMGGGIGGCGYDKQSTATAEALNALLKPYLFRLSPKWFTRVRNDNGTTKSGMPYGISSGTHEEQKKMWTLWDPHFDGGVGVNCHEEIVRYLGGKIITHEGGKDWDLYEYLLPPFKEIIDAK